MIANTKKWKCKYYEQLHLRGATKITAHLTKMKNSNITRCPNVLEEVFALFNSKGCGSNICHWFATRENPKTQI
jgi:hypothetical protein